MGAVFEKIEGLGNDFIVVDARVALGVETARALCDRHRGIGADGVLLVDASAPSMRVINADGSRPEMCGNGIRCVVLSFALRGRVRVGETIVIDTEAGPHTCTLLAHDGETASVRVAMRPYSIEPDPKLVSSTSPMLDAEITLGQARVRGTFPAQINVGLAELLDPRTIALRVYERGVGYTEACGTGACAAAAAAVETGRVERGVPIEVRLPGGVLEIVVGDRGAPVLTTGPARRVFRGEL